MIPPLASSRAKVMMAIVTHCMLASMAANAGSEIHRCSGTEGVTYTDRGCDRNAQASSLVHVAALGSASDLRPAVDREWPVTLGMSPRMVFDALGRPAETIATLQGRTLVEYWLYRSASGVTRVAFQEGRVSRVDAR